MSMTLKDLLKGQRDLVIRIDVKTTLVAALLQGGGLGIYGDVLFKEVRDSKWLV
jgi:hypothetical protein